MASVVGQGAQELRDRRSALAVAALQREHSRPPRVDVVNGGQRVWVMFMPVWLPIVQPARDTEEGSVAQIS